MKHVRTFLWIVFLYIGTTFFIGCGSHDPDDTPMPDESATPVSTSPAAEIPIEFAAITTDYTPAHTIRGVVVDAATKLPLVGAEVRVKWFDNERVRLRHDTTDAEGEFQFAFDALSETVFVGAQMRGYYSYDRRWTGEPVVLALSPGETVRVTVSVRNDEGEPVADAVVGVRTSDMAQLRQWRPRLFSCEAVTDEHGVCVLPHVPAGLDNLHLLVQHDAYPRHEAFRQSFSTKRGDTSVDIVLRRGIDVQGHVVRASGTPVSGAQVWAQYVDTSTFDPRMLARERQRPVRGAHGVTDDDGAFSFGNIVASRAFVLVCAVESFPALHLGPWSRKNPPPDDIVFVLPDALGRLIGSFTDAHGAPVTNVIVTHYLQEQGKSRVYVHPLHIDIEEDGSYVSDYLVPGTYTFSFETTRAFKQVHTETITAHGMHIHDVTFSCVPVVTGIVMDAATESPIADVKVVMQHWGRTVSHTNNTTDHTGMFLVDDLYQVVSFIHPDYAPREEVSFGDRTEMATQTRVYLSAATSARVVAQFSDGMPVTNMYVRLLGYREGRSHEHYNETRFTEFNSDGIAYFTNIPSHISPVIAQIENNNMRMAESAPHALTPHEIVDIPVFLPPFGSLSLFFSEPVTGRHVYVGSSTFHTHFFERDITEWHLSTAHTGTHQMVILLDRMIHLQTNITIFPNRTTDFYVDMTMPGGSIRGTVIHEDGTAAQAYIICRPVDSAHRETLSLHARSTHTHDGEFTVRGLCERTLYTVQVYVGGTNLTVHAVMPNTTPLHITAPIFYTLTGRLEDANGAPVKAHIMWSDDTIFFHGDFSIRLFGGTHTVYITPEKFAPIALPIHINADTDIGTIILRDPGVTLRGRVVSSDGAPIPNTDIGCLTRDFFRDRFEANTTTSSDGTFVLRGIPPEKSLILAVNDKDNHQLFRLGPFPSGEHDYGDIVLGEIGYVHVTAYKPDGTPASDAYLNHQPLDEKGTGVVPEIAILLFNVREPESFDDFQKHVYLHDYTPIGAGTNYITVTLPAHLWDDVK